MHHVRRPRGEERPGRQLSYDLSAPQAVSYSDADPASAKSPRASFAAREWLEKVHRPRVEKARAVEKAIAIADPAASFRQYIRSSVEEARAQSSIAAASSMFAAHEEMHLAAVAAGAVSPLHTTPTALDESPTLPRVPVQSEAAAGVAVYRKGDLIGYRPAHVVHIAEVDSPAHVDQSSVFEGDFITQEEIDYTAEMVRRLPEFSRICSQTAGEIIDEKTAADGQASAKALEKLSLDLALSLVSAGVPAFRTNHKGFHMVDPVTRKVKFIHPFRNICFIPAVAAAKRRKILPHLEFLCERNRSKAKLITLTGGQRVPLDEAGALRDAVTEIQRDVSNLAANPYFKAYDAEIVFRGTEFGTAHRACHWPRRGAAAIISEEITKAEKAAGWYWLPSAELDRGTIWFHVHVHVFVLFHSKLSDEKWEEFMAAMWGKAAGIPRLWAHHWSYDGKLQKPKEACKYPMKPIDLHTAAMSPDECKAMFGELKGLHLVQCLGVLRDQKNARFANAEKGTKVEGSTGKSFVRFGPDWNASGPRDMEKRRADVRRYARRARAKLARFQVAAALIAAACRPCESRTDEDRAAAKALAVWIALKMPRTSVETRWAPAIEQIKAAEEAVRPPAAPGLRVLGRIAPNPHFDRVKRPALFVQGWTGSDRDWEELARKPFVQEICNISAGRLAAADAQLAKEAREKEALGTESPNTEFTPSLKLLLHENGQNLALNLGEKS